MLRTAHCVAFFVSIPFLVHAEASKKPDAIFDYVQPLQAGFIEGALDSAYEVACGYTTRAQISEAGYLSIYKKVYWLLGAPYQSWNFDVRTDFPESAAVRISLVIDGHKINYPETISVSGGIAGSGGDLCGDDLGGYCPTQSNADVLRDVGQKLKSAKSLTFIVSSKQKTERLTMRADFRVVLTGWMILHRPFADKSRAVVTLIDKCPHS